MKRFTVTLMALLTLGVGAWAGTQADQEATPKPKTKVAPAPKAYAMAMSSKGGSYLGVDIREITSDRVAPLKLKEERGVEITMVDRDAPAGKAGLKENDVILEMNGTRIEGEEQLRRMLRETPAGRKVTLGISRDGQPMQIEATLAARESSMGRIAPKVWKVEPPDMSGFSMPDIQIPAIEMVVRSYSRRTGMMVDNLTPQLGEFFGVKSGRGVLVRSVEKGSAAEAAGLKAGDVIVKVDNEEIDDRNDWNRALRRKGGATTFGIVRDKREQNVTVTLPEVKSSEEGRFFEFDGETEFEWEPKGFDNERFERAMRKLRQELDVNRIVDRHIVVQKAMAERQARSVERLADAQKRMQESMEKAQERMRHNQEKLKMKLEHAARGAQRI